MKDNFDLRKYLAENKVIENQNPYFNSISEGENTLRNKIKEMIIKELEDYQGYDEEEIDMGTENPEDMFDDIMTLGDTKEDSDLFDDEFGLFEVEEDEAEDEAEEEGEEEDLEPTDDEATLGTIEADMEGDDSEIMNSLMSALKIAKSTGNEKLTTQISNTIKFYVSEYIGGEE